MNFFAHFSKPSLAWNRELAATPAGIAQLEEKQHADKPFQGEQDFASGPFLNRIKDF